MVIDPVNIRKAITEIGREEARSRLALDFPWDQAKAQVQLVVWARLCGYEKLRGLSPRRNNRVLAGQEGIDQRSDLDHGRRFHAQEGDQAENPMQVEVDD